MQLLVFAHRVHAHTAFEMTVERLEGVRKLSQNKPAEAQARLAQALDDLGGEDALALSRLTGKI